MSSLALLEVIIVSFTPESADAHNGGWVRADGGIQRFCKECGTAVQDANFCPRCGLATENTSGAHTSQPEEHPQQAPTGHSGHSRAWWLTIAAVAAAVIVGLVAVLVVVIGQEPSGPTYTTKSRLALAPVIQQNQQLASTLRRLSSRSGHAKASGSVETTTTTVRSAQRELAKLTPGAGDRALAASARTALTSELAWLSAAGSVLKNPTSPMLTQLGSLGLNARSKLRAIDAQVPAASESLPDSAKLIAYAQARRSAVSTTSALRQFSAQVQALLTQSGPAFTQINQLFGQMQTAASGGTPTITLAQAEATLTAVISNRTSLAASARTLDAPTPLAATVRADLVAAMDASLTNDHDISTCLNEANTGTTAVIFQGCLSSTAADSTAATNAKHQFLADYNTLRSQIGQPAISVQF
jgi:hypothetical protein